MYCRRFSFPFLLFLLSDSLLPSASVPPSNSSPSASGVSGVGFSFVLSGISLVWLEEQEAVAVSVAVLGGSLLTGVRRGWDLEGLY